jgi:hypothetical protein
MSLLETTHQIRREAFPTLQRNLRVSVKVGKEVAGATKTLIPLRTSLLNNIRFLHLTVPSEYTFFPSNDMPHLQRVEVESKYEVVITLRPPDTPNNAITSPSTPTPTPPQPPGRANTYRGLDTSALSLIGAIQFWHLDLLNEPEIPVGTGSWGLLYTILNPGRAFAVHWTGKVKVAVEIGSNGFGLVDDMETYNGSAVNDSGYNRATAGWEEVLTLGFDWDQQRLILDDSPYQTGLGDGDGNRDWDRIGEIYGNEEGEMARDARRDRDRGVRGIAGKYFTWYE